MKTLLDPLDALAEVKASAGASKSRDSIDNYLINTELSSYGKLGALISDPTKAPINGPGTINGGTVCHVPVGAHIYNTKSDNSSHLKTRTEMAFRTNMRGLMGRIPMSMTLQRSH